MSGDPAARDESLPPRVSAPALTDGERKVGLALGIVAGIAFVVLSGGRALFLAVGLTMAVALTFAAWRGSRLGAAFAAFATTFGPWSFAAVFGAPYAIYAFWILAKGRRLMDPTAPPGPSAGRRGARRDGGRVT